MDADNAQSERNETENLRREMVDRLKNLGLIQTAPVEEAFRAIPRHLFVPKVEIQTAYTDTYIVTREQDGQPISSSSQPSIMAIMLEMLDLRPGQRVLEIGAGTGYNAALLAYLVGKTGLVVTIDIDEDIVQEARSHLQAAGVTNVRAVCADGSLGWIEDAPYDRVILTVCATDIAPAWREQLRPGGRIVLPLQLTSFQSRFAAIPFMLDQFAFSFEWTGTVFESLDFRPCGFMRLRGDLAQEVSKTYVRAAEVGLSGLFSKDIDGQSIFQVLRGPVQDEETGVHLSVLEMAGLRLWLAIRDSLFCEIYVQKDAAIGAIPMLLQRDRTFTTAIGLCERQTCCLLRLQEEESDRVIDARRPFKLVIRRFGPDRALVEQLRTQVMIWDEIGHPLVWNQDARMKDLHVRAWPIETPYTPHPYEGVLIRPHTRFVFSSKSHLSA